MKISERNYERNKKLFPKGKKVEGVVVTIARFGVFVEITEKELTTIGFIHLVAQLVFAGYTDTSSFKLGEVLNCVIIGHRFNEIFLALEGFENPLTN